MIFTDNAVSFVYDVLGRVESEMHLDRNVKMCYTYDERSRVTQRTVIDYNAEKTTEEVFGYDAAGNIISTEDEYCDACCALTYDTNNRLTSFNGMPVTYDADGNMQWSDSVTCTYDSSNRLISAGGHTYTYNADNIRIRNLCGDSDTTYVYNTNAKLMEIVFHSLCAIYAFVCILAPCLSNAVQGYITTG